MFGLLQEPPTRRSCSSAISNDQDEIELPHHRNRYTPQPPTTARGTYPQKFNSPQTPLFSTADGIFRFRGGYTRSNELGRELGITQQTFYRWRRKFGGMEVSDAQELNRLLGENRR